MANRDKPRARFRDRMHAGQELAADLQRFVHGQEPVVLAIPPDGVPVAATICMELGAPLDVIASRWIVAPGFEGDALGAVTPDRTLVINRPLVSRLGFSDEEVEQLSIPVWAEVQKSQQVYRGGRPYPDLRDRTVVIVGDGLTSGHTMMAAVMSVRKLEPARVIVAVPVASIEAVDRIRQHVDTLLFLEIGEDAPFSVGEYYSTYHPLSDQEVTWILERMWSEHPLEGYNETF